MNFPHDQRHQRTYPTIDIPANPPEGFGIVLIHHPHGGAVGYIIVPIPQIKELVKDLDTIGLDGSYLK